MTNLTVETALTKIATLHSLSLALRDTAYTPDQQFAIMLPELEKLADAMRSAVAKAAIDAMSFIPDDSKFVRDDAAAHDAEPERGDQ